MNQRNQESLIDGLKKQCEKLSSDLATERERIRVLTEDLETLDKMLDNRGLSKYGGARSYITEALAKVRE